MAGGLLVRRGVDAPGRLEFREILDRRSVLAAVHDFTPSLPWGLYKYSQALVHLWVMKGFARHLARQGAAQTLSVAREGGESA